MPAVWRIAADTPVYGADDLTGKGAQLTGGRWNRRGTPLVYASLSVALTCLETLVHLGGGNPLPLNRYLVQIDVPQPAWDLRTRFDAAIHHEWDAEPAGPVSLEWGTAWAHSLVSLVAEVPSIVVPEELNVLLNPRHAAAAGLVARRIRSWTYDARLT
jgi:RES domain-containing protein